MTSSSSVFGDEACLGRRHGFSVDLFDGQANFGGSSGGGKTRTI